MGDQTAIRISTGVSQQEYEKLTSIAEGKRVTLAAVLRWCVEAYLEKRPS